MKKLVRPLFIVLSSVLVISTIPMTGVYADNGGDGSSTSKTSTSSGSGDSSGGTSTSTTTSSGDHESGTTSGTNSTTSTELPSSESHSETTSASGEDSTTEVQAETTFRNEGEQLLTTDKETHHSGKSAADITKACDASKNGIETKTASLVSDAQASLARINNTLSEAVTFQKSSNLSVPNLSALIAAATSAQTQATTSARALAALNPTLDCASTSVAAEVTTFQAALGQTRTDLITYRTAVENLLSALGNAS